MSDRPTPAQIVGYCVGRGEQVTVESFARHGYVIAHPDDVRDWLRANLLDGESSGCGYGLVAGRITIDADILFEYVIEALQGGDR